MPLGVDKSRSAPESHLHKFDQEGIDRFAQMRPTGVPESTQRVLNVVQNLTVFYGDADGVYYCIENILIDEWSIRVCALNGNEWPHNLQLVIRDRMIGRCCASNGNALTQLRN